MKCDVKHIFTKQISSNFKLTTLSDVKKLNRNANVRVYDIVVCLYTFQDSFCRSNVWIGILIDICITSCINRCYTQDVIHSKYLKLKNQYSSFIISNRYFCLLGNNSSPISYLGLPHFESHKDQDVWLLSPDV